MVELEHNLTLVGASRFVVGPRGRVDLQAAVRLSVKPGGLKEDSREVAGVDGATRTFLGYADAELTAEIQVWDEEWLPQVRRLADLFRPRREAKPAPLSIIHPAALRWGIKQVYLVEIQERAWSPKEGLQVTLQMREWQPTEKRKTQGTAPITGPGGGIPEATDIAAPSKQGVPTP